MSNELLYFILGAGLNLLVALLVVRFVYYPATQDKTYVFTFLAFNTVIYFVLGLLTSANLSVGVGFGLFAIFSVLRYRTDEMPIREMTYLFILIALPVMNSVMISEAKVAMLFVEMCIRDRCIAQPPPGVNLMMSPGAKGTPPTVPLLVAER